MQTVSTKPTVRSLMFPSVTSLHAFQHVITRWTVRFDALASFFAISRRRMVVPIYKKLEATKVRIQVITQGGIIQVAAFFEDFAPADAMIFQVRASDVVEKAKGDKGARYRVKLVDAKFTLPRKGKEGLAGDDGHEEAGTREGGMGWPTGVKRRFVNLENLDYAEEHDDLTIGFENEDGMWHSSPCRVPVLKHRFANVG